MARSWLFTSGAASSRAPGLTKAEPAHHALMQHEHADRAKGCEHADDGEHDQEGSPYQRLVHALPLIFVGGAGTHPQRVPGDLRPSS